MASRLLCRLDAAIAAACDPLERDVLMAERAGLFARKGRVAEARAALAPLHRNHAHRPHAASAAALGLADALVDFYTDMGGQARIKLQQANALAASASRPALQAMAAAWLAQLDYLDGDFDGLLRHLALSLRVAAPEHHSARSRACLVAALSYHHGMRFDRAQPWYECSRRHANEEGDTATLSALLHNMAAVRGLHARCASVFSPSGATIEDVQCALGGAVSSGNFDDLAGASALPILQVMLRAQMFAVQDRTREALAIYDAYLGAALAQGLARIECCYRADMAWCHMRLGRADAARQQATLALAAVRPHCDIDDVAFTHGRLAQVYRGLQDEGCAARHEALAQERWQRHLAEQARMVERLDATLAPFAPQ